MTDDDKLRAFLVALLKLVRHDAKLQDAIFRGATPEFTDAHASKRVVMFEDAVGLLREITGGAP